MSDARETARRVAAAWVLSATATRPKAPRRRSASPDGAAGARGRRRKVNAEEARAFRRAARDQLAIDHLWDFVQQLWYIVEPGGELQPNWHHGAICRELEAVTNGTLTDEDGKPCRELVICVPPRSLKTRLVSVFWQAWWWLRDPTEKVLSISNDDALAGSASREMRKLVTHPHYQRLKERAAINAAAARGEEVARRRDGSIRTWGTRTTVLEPERDAEGNIITWGMERSQAAVLNFANTASGSRICLSVGGRITGKGAGGIIVDDPYDVKEALRGTPEAVGRKMQWVVDQYDKVYPTRLNDPRRGWRVTIMQRLHDNDLAGALLARKGVRKVVIPMEFEPGRPDRYDLDPRTTAGELLFGERFTEEVIAALKRPEGDGGLGAIVYSSQYQQRPMPAAGGLFARAWFTEEHWYRERPERIRCPLQIIAMDAAFKDKSTSSYVVIQVWGVRGAELFLLHQVRAHMTYTETKAAFMSVCAEWPLAKIKVIEDKALGTAVIAEFKKAVPGIIAFPGDKWAHLATKDKYERAQVGSVPPMQAGNVYIPAPEVATFPIGTWVEEHCAFPNAPNDDQVDTTSMALIVACDGKLIDPMARLKQQFGAIL